MEAEGKLNTEKEKSCLRKLPQGGFQDCLSCLMASLVLSRSYKYVVLKHTICMWI